MSDSIKDQKNPGIAQHPLDRETKYSEVTWYNATHFFVYSFHYPPFLKQCRRQPNGYAFPMTEFNCEQLLHHEGEFFNLEDRVKQHCQMVVGKQSLQDDAITERIDLIKKREAVDILDYNFKEGITPYAHQTVAIDMMMENKQACLFLDMGTGKTMVTINTACALIQTGEVEKINMLVVCPKSIMYTWEKELEKHASIPYICRRLWPTPIIPDHICDVIVGASRNKNIKLRVFITTYDTFRNVLPLIEERILPIDMLVADESTKIKTFAAKRTKALLESREYIERRYILTGSAVTQGVQDLYPQTEVVKKGACGFTSKRAFDWHYTVQLGPNKTIPRNTDELLSRLARIPSLIVKKEDCIDLPSKSYTFREVNMSEEQLEVYEQMEKTFLAQLHSEDKVIDAPVIIVQLLRLAQIVSGHLPIEYDNSEPPKPIKFKDFMPNERLEDCIDLVDEILKENHKVIIWARFRRNIQVLMNEFDCYGLRYAQIWGDTKDAGAEMDRFNNDNNCNILIGNPRSGGHGLTLIGNEQKPVSDIIYYTNSYSLDDRRQSEDRCHRIGMFCPVTYHDYLVPNTIDYRIVQALSEKKEVADMFTNADLMKKVIMEVG